MREKAIRNACATFLERMMKIVSKRQMGRILSPSPNQKRRKKNPRKRKSLKKSNKTLRMKSPSKKSQRKKSLRMKTSKSLKRRRKTS